MGYEIFKWLHLTGVFLLIYSTSSLILLASLGVLKKEAKWRKGLAMVQGIGFIITLIGGFGLVGMLRLGMPWPFWVWAKIAILIFISMIYVVAKRKPEKASLIWVIGLLAALLAVVLAVFKI